jgi:hypothetical protein
MAFWVSQILRFRNEVEEALKKHFGNKVDVDRNGGKCLTVKFKPDAGYVREVKNLSEEELASDVCGGGSIEALDGCIFVVGLDKVIVGGLQ